jgi:hypothetical protein
MILFNKLIRTDLALVAGMIVLLFVPGHNVWIGILEGFCGALFVMSIIQHIQHYKLTKKFY